MATTVTVMNDTQTHSVVMVNADGGGLDAGTIVLTDLLGAQLNALGGSSTVTPRVAITKIESSCGPSAAPAPNTGYTIEYGGSGGPLFIHEGTLKLDNLNLIMSTPVDVVVTPLDGSVSFTAILTLKKIKGFAGSASMAKIG